ncbi:hypothetical protein quinque_015667 [Culex quinquefasciatus]|uniref:GATA zinc finger domain-containing protein 10 n=1 Tax=Culex quinquefasciatus TaxID=7176 RepID=UPI0018E2AA39|nr:GATA zinc finger domain-containing protein 10 [Culex quinquefasciatus]
MLDGWYCRSINEQAQQAQQQQQMQQADPQPHSSSSHQAAVAVRNSNNNVNANNNSSDGEDMGGPDGGDSTEQSDPDSDEDVMPTRRNIDYKAQYNELKKKLKYLLYENEFFQENLRTSQRRLLKITRDRSFLLDRLLQYEKVDVTSSEDEDTESSDDSSKPDPVPTVGRKRKNEPSLPSAQSQSKNPPKRRKPGPNKQLQQQQQQLVQPNLLQQRQFQASMLANNHGHHPQQHQLMQDGHLTAEEVERHLQSRAQAMSLVPEGELPNEMFSQNPSSESNDPMVDTSPSNIGEECLSADMNMMQQE